MTVARRAMVRRRRAEAVGSNAMKTNEVVNGLTITKTATKVMIRYSSNTSMVRLLE